MEKYAAARAKVFVIWEPILPTDWMTPSPSLTSMLPDRRATHFWDRGRRLSAAMGGPGAIDALADVRNVGFEMKDVIWDTALVYPPGAHWGGKASTLIAPVVDYPEELAQVLAR